MNLYVANTDEHWYQYLLSQQPVDEVNFWRPMGNTTFSAIREGELFLFKLKKKHGGHIVGFGQFLMYQPMNVRDAWDFFGKGNGVDSLQAMIHAIHQYTKSKQILATRDHTIGAIIVTNPTFLPREHWIRTPEDWKDQIVTGKTYSTEQEIGQRLFQDCFVAADRMKFLHDGDGIGEMGEVDSIGEMDAVREVGKIDKTGKRYGTPTLLRMRLGQGGFRMKIRSIYGKCAISGEHSLPVLEAAHIRSYADQGGHEITNGILFRSDIHKLYDRGYVTVDPDYRFQVSGRLNEEFNNGKTYYQLDQKKIWLPNEKDHWPDQQNLEYHREHVFLG
ncbi:MAG: HNH endonuclease [Balneolaceae bacterium]